MHRASTSSHPGLLLADTARIPVAVLQRALQESGDALWAAAGRRKDVPTCLDGGISTAALTGTFGVVFPFPRLLEDCLVFPP